MKEQKYDFVSVMFIYARCIAPPTFDNEARFEQQCPTGGREKRTRVRSWWSFNRLPSEEAFAYFWDDYDCERTCERVRETGLTGASSSGCCSPPLLVHEGQGRCGGGGSEGRTNCSDDERVKDDGLLVCQSLL